jgi:hypothetical protein
MTPPTIDAALDATATRCDHCSKPFTRRKESGGKPQRFCSPECRTTFHSENRQRGQRGPTCRAVTEPAVIPIAERTEATHEAAEARLSANLEKHPEKSDFDWPSDDSVVLAEQLAISVYFHRRDVVVIRQRASGDEEEDTFIYIARQHIPEFIRRLADLVGIPGVGKK